MTELELQTRILDFIKEIYKAEFVGYLEVERNEDTYILYIGIPSYMYPTMISGSFDTDDEFLAYVEHELKTRNYIRV